MTSTRLRSLVLALVATALLVGASACDWRMAGFGADRSGYNAGETGITAANVATLALRWQASGTQGGVGPVVADGVVYVLVDIPNPADPTLSLTAVRALDEASGDELWTASTQLPESGWGHGLAVSDSTIYVVAPWFWGGSGLVALDRATGAFEWVRGVSSWYQHDPLVVGDLVFVGNLAVATSGDYGLFTGGPDNRVLAVDGGAAFFATDAYCQPSTTVVAFDTGSGSQRWSYALPDGLDATSAVAADGRVTIQTTSCSGSATTGTMSFDEATGALRWSLPSVTVGGAAAHQLLGTTGDGLLARSSLTGEPTWDHAVAGCATTTNVATSGQVVFAAGADTLCAVDVHTGAELGRWSVHGVERLAVADGCVFLTVGTDVPVWCVDGAR